MKNAFNQEYFIETCQKIGLRPKLIPSMLNDMDSLDLSEFS